MFQPSNDSGLGSNVESTAQQLINVAKLSLQFREILIRKTWGPRPKEIESSSSRSSADSTNRYRSISTSDSTSLTLHYEDYRTLHVLLREKQIEDLRSIAQTLNSTASLHDCLRFYIGWRKDMVNLILKRLIEKIDYKAVCFSKNCESLGENIQLWIQVAKICVVKIFVKEKSLYEKIFGGDDHGYVGIIGNAAAKLFDHFAHSLMISRQITKRLEILLPVYQELLDLMPIINLLFDKDHSCLAKTIHSTATAILVKIAQHMIRIVSAAERQVLGELSVILTSGGNIHPMTDYVIRYLELISDHRNSLTDLIASSQVFEDPPRNDEDASPLKNHAGRIIEFLLHNLRQKSRFYEQESLGHFFMMNNIYHVAQKINASQRMQELIDKDLYTKLTEKVDQEMFDYVKITWDGVCGCLIRNKISKTLSIRRSMHSGNSTKGMKVKSKNFNTMIEDVLEMQRQWSVRDNRLLEKLHGAILEKLIPAYTAFLEHFSSRIEKLRHPERFIKYSNQDLYIKVLNLFQCQVHL